MIQDPYKVLGVSPGASDEEIKKAYRALAKKYHPDVNPGDKEAERKMNEINAAYDQLKNPQNYRGAQGGGAGSQGTGFGGFGDFGDFGGFGGFGGFGNGFGGFGGFNPGNTQEESNELKAARNYIRSRHFKEAMNVLNGVPERERKGRWHYLMALANYGMGNRIAALENAERAVSHEPDNYEYQSLLNELAQGKKYYSSYAGGYNPGGMSISPCLACLGISFLSRCLCPYCRCFFC